MDVRWSPQAANDLVAIVSYVKLDNASAAHRIREIIRAGVNGLTLFPNRGRAGSSPHTREIVFAPLPYLVIYRVTDRHIEVVRVLHGAQSRP